MASLLFEWLTNQIGSLQKTNWTWEATHLINRRGEKEGWKHFHGCVCVIFSCRCVCWILGGSFTPCGYRIPGIPLGTYCTCRRVWSSPLVRVVKFNYQFSRHYISLMSHRRTIACQPIFVFCMFPMCCLWRSQNHLRFHPIIVLQTSTFMYIYN
jgi:hypothetical protein